VVAPAGYGKTTLLAQWAEFTGQAFAWVSVDEKDNDPKVLLTYVAEALNAVEPVGKRVFDALASPGSSVPGSVVPRLGSAFSSMSSPVVLVLDDVHLLADSACRAALSVLADHVPGGSRLVLAGRDEPPLRLARLRAEGRLLEIGPGDLALTSGEASTLLRNARVVLGADDVAELHRRTEGWPAGLYLAALYLREGGSLEAAVGSFGGQDRFVSEYIESEFLARISGRQRVFLTRTAALGRMCGPLCDAVLGADGGAATLAGLARSNLLLVPLDRQGKWYRYHHLFRDMLLAELDRGEPALIPVLRHRAAAWCLDNGLAEEALEYSIAAGDVDRTARLVEQLWRPVYRQGRIITIQRWLRWLEDQREIRGYPMVAVLASLVAAFWGQPAEAERWADVVDRWQPQASARPRDLATEAWAAQPRGLLCRRGFEQLRADADEAARRFMAENIVTATPAVLQGFASVLRGDLEHGDACFQEAVSVAESEGMSEELATALCERSLLAMARGETDQAQALADQARTVLAKAGIEESFLTPGVCAVHARLALLRGDALAARRELVTAQRSRGLLTYAVPYLAVQARIELTRVYLALSDLAGARTLMREIDEVLKRRPGLGTLAGEAAALRARLDNRLGKERGAIAPGPSALTAAELRVLPLLPTHMPAREIAAQLFLSHNTIRTEMKSIYRKLGAATRSQAVTQARQLGLLEG
jgi:LuxR family maltose regulon positive regulatory protein